MSWTDVRSQIVQIVESAEPGTELELRNDFRHIRTADEDNPPGTRDFWIALRSGSTAYPNVNTCRSRYADVEVVIAYENHTHAAALDEAIGEDYEAIAEKLLDVTTWGRSTTGIESIAMVGGDTVLEFSIDEVDGGRLLVVGFPVQYRS